MSGSSFNLALYLERARRRFASELMINLLVESKRRNAFLDADGWPLHVWKVRPSIKGVTVRCTIERKQILVGASKGYPQISEPNPSVWRHSYDGWPLSDPPSDARERIVLASIEATRDRWVGQCAAIGNRWIVAEKSLALVRPLLPIDLLALGRLPKIGATVFLRGEHYEVVDGFSWSARRIDVSENEKKAP